MGIIGPGKIANRLAKELNVTAQNMAGTWPLHKPFPSLAKDITTHLKDILPDDHLNKLTFQSPQTLRYNLRTLPNEIENGISTSLIFSSWNVVTYVGQIDNDKVREMETNNQYVQHIQKAIKKYGSLWFNDEMLIIGRKE